MVRKIINIDEEKCNGCGLCADACHEGAIGMVDGKAKLLRDDYCDGLGDCLPVCPTGAITFVEREAAPFDKQAVMANMQQPAGCPGRMAHAIPRGQATAQTQNEAPRQSELRQWPVQIKLAPVNAPYFDGAKLLIAADCTAFSYGDFHQLMKNHVTLIGCPKLDEVDYSEKLSEIIRNNDIIGIKVARMEVPCCGGIVQAVQRALEQSGKTIPWSIVTISTDGRILDD